MYNLNDKSIPLVTIITPVYNGSKYVEELIKSVLEQDYSRIEHIIIDDGSNDNGATVNILKRYPHLRWWSRQNKGQYATLNEGIAASKGDLVTMICADDKYASRTALSATVSLWSADRECDAVYGDTIFIDEKGHVLPNEPPRSAPIWLFRYYHGVAHCSLLVRRQVICDKKIYFDETFAYMGDYDWIIRLISAGCRFKRIRKPIAMYRLHPTQRSKEINYVRIEEERRITQLYGNVNPIIEYMVNKWWRLTKLRNMFIHRGPLACFYAIKACLYQDNKDQIV